MSGIRPEGYRPEAVDQTSGLVITATHDLAELIGKIRNIPLLNGVIEGFRPYRQSTITLESVPLDLLHPCALYVLGPQLEIITQLRAAFLEKGIDPLGLTPNQAIIDYNWGERQNCSILSPVVEVSVDDGGILVVADGLHRVAKAKKLGLPTITVVKITNTAAPLPVLPVRWEEIQTCDAVPPTEQKRRFRFQSMTEIWEWIYANFDRFIQGLDFPEKLSWMHCFQPEVS